MNGYQRISAALKGERPDAVPVMLHNFMHAAREAGVPMGRYRRDPEAMARVHIRAVEKYGCDGVLLDLDTATLAGALGVPVDLPEDQPGRCHDGILPSLDAVRALPPPDVGRYFAVRTWLEAASILQRHFGREVFIRGNADQCPFSLAGLLRGPVEWMMDLKDPKRDEDARRLLDYCAEACLQFLRLMAATGVPMVSNGDSPAGPDLVSPAFYRRFAFPWEKRVVDEVHRLGLPYALHICGDTTRILDDMISTGADALELDYKTDVRQAHAKMKDRATFIGNLDPSAVLAAGTPAEVEAKARELVGLFSDTPRFILNAGCAIPATAPGENIRALIRAARS